ncbi:MAG: kelch repeat-containing protein [Acidobacteriota bacterium]
MSMPRARLSLLALVPVVAVPLALGRAAAQTWIPGPATQQARSAFGIAYDSGRSVTVLFGGDPGTTYYLNDTWEFDGTRWRPGPIAPSGLIARQGQAMTYDSNRGRVVLFGGTEIAGTRNDTWEYDGAAWTQGPTAPPALTNRAFAAMAFDTGRNLCVMVGGFGGPMVYDETWEYDGTAWTLGAAGISARESAAIAYDPGRARIVVFGGNDGSPTSTDYLNDTWEYDGTTWTLGPAAPPLLFPRAGASMTFDAQRNRCLLYAGTRKNQPPLNDSWMYDGTAWTQTSPPASGMIARTAHGIAFDLVAMKTVMFGGKDRNQLRLRDTWLEDGTQWAAGPPPLGPTPRSLHTACYDSARRRVVIFGGTDPTGTLKDVFEYDGVSWTMGATPPAGMVARTRHAMAFDSTRSKAVVFGGADSTNINYLNDTWEYDGAWTQGPSSPAALDARRDHAMVFDSARATCVMFGGRQVSVQPYNDTWEYDGSAWTQGPAAPAGLTPRFDHDMAFDSARNVTVLFGGTNAAGIRFAETWEYDGNAWTQGPAAPPALTGRFAHAMAFDAERGVTVLFGGYDGSSPLPFTNDTWEFDGTAWTLGATAPSALGIRDNHPLAFDSLRGRTLLFGGYNGDVMGDHWELGARECYITGAGLGISNENRVRYYGITGSLEQDFLAYAAGKWGVNVTAGDIDGPSYEEAITGPGPGDVFGPQVRAFRRDATSINKVNFYAYGTLKFGVNVGTARLDSDAFDEILTGAGPGLVFGPHVRGWNYDGVLLTPMSKVSYFAYLTLKFGVNVSSGDVDGDGYAEILTGPGPAPSFRPQVRGWNFDGVGIASMAKINFDAFTTLQYGANVAGGDADADGFAEIVCTPGPGPTSSFPARFRGFNFDNASIAALPGYDITPYASLYGARAGQGNVIGADNEELLASPGRDPFAPSTVRTYKYQGASLVPVLTPFPAFPGTFYGANPAAGDLGYY